MQEWSTFPAFSPAFCAAAICYFSHSGGCVVISHWGFGPVFAESPRDRRLMSPPPPPLPRASHLLYMKLRRVSTSASLLWPQFRSWEPHSLSLCPPLSSLSRKCSFFGSGHSVISATSPKSCFTGLLPLQSPYFFHPQTRISWVPIPCNGLSPQLRNIQTSKIRFPLSRCSSSIEEQT